MPAFVCCHKVSLTEVVSGWLFVMRGEMLFVVCCCDVLLLLPCIVLMLFIVSLLMCVMILVFGDGGGALLQLQCIVCCWQAVWLVWWINCLVSMQCRCCCALKCSVIVLSSPSLIHPPQSNHSFIHEIIHLSTFHSFIHLPFVVWTIDYVHSFINPFIPSYLPIHRSSFFHSSILSFIRCFIHGFIHSFIHSFINIKLTQRCGETILDWESWKVFTSPHPIIHLSTQLFIYPPSIHLSIFQFVVWTIDCVHSFINSFIPSYLPAHLSSFFHSSILSFIHCFIPSLLHSWIRPFLHSSIESSHNNVAKQCLIERIERFSHIDEKVCSHYENWSH